MYNYLSIVLSRNSSWLLWNDPQSLPCTPRTLGAACAGGWGASRRALGLRTGSFTGTCCEDCAHSSLAHYAAYSLTGIRLILPRFLGFVTGLVLWLWLLLFLLLFYLRVEFCLRFLVVLQCRAVVLLLNNPGSHTTPVFVC